MEKTGRKKSLAWWSLAGLELATTGFRVRVLTVRPKTLVKLKWTLKACSMVSISNIE